MCKKTYKSWIAAIAAITACVLFAVNFRVTFVDGQSMEPTLKSHQLVLVKRTAASIQRDDIIVFRVDETVYIKRVVAVAGDTVQLKDSRVYINHVYLSPYTCDADIAAAYNLEADHYFVLGDNDGASIDSRDFAHCLLSAENRPSQSFCRMVIASTYKIRSCPNCSATCATASLCRTLSQ